MKKAATERLGITVAGDQLDYPGKVTTCTMELNTVKIHLNSVLSTINAEYTTMDLKDFYLNIPMAQKEYTRLKVEFIPKSFMDKHNLWDMVGNGHVHIEIYKGMYGPPQTGRLANNLLKKQLLPHRYYK